MNSLDQTVHSADLILQTSRVLVVDDSRLMRLGLIRALNTLGVQLIEEAANGRQALDKIRVESFDLMLLDVEMPEMNGIELLLAMKAEPELGRLPVIVISSAEQVETAVKCIEAGAQDYLPKNFNPTLLRARVLSSVEKKRLRDVDARRVVELQAERDRLEKTQKRLDEELAQAALYVRSIFPASMHEPLAVDWFYQPTSELAGDAFGYHWIDSEHFAVYLLDVCGHGVGACLLAVTAINVIRTGALTGIDFRQPAAVMAGVSNAFLCEQHNDMYFTLWYGVYHAPTRTLRHASGGHPPALLLLPPQADGTTPSVQLRSPGMIVGVLENLQYEEQAINVPEGSCLILPCDGCFEIMDNHGVDATYEDFEDFMVRHGTQPEGLAGLFEWAKARHGDGPLDDDFSLVRVRF